MTDAEQAEANWREFAGHHRVNKLTGECFICGPDLNFRHAWTLADWIDEVRAMNWRLYELNL